MSIKSAMKTIENAEGVIIMDDALLHRFQNALMDIVKEFAEVCKKNDIKWCLSGGSIIGAVRHNGFIPWDDDIDIFMERAEYEKFKSIFCECMGERYNLKEPGDKGYLLPFPRIQKKGTVVRTIQSSGNKGGALSVDIFILENTYNNIILRTIHGLKCTALLFICSTLRMNICKDNILKHAGSNEMLKNKVKSRARYAKLFGFFPTEKWFSITEKCFSKVRKSREYVVAPGGGGHFFGEVFKRSELCTYIQHPFNGERFFIPAGYDYYLRKRYGDDYMTPPPESRRERHAYLELIF